MDPDPAPDPSPDDLLRRLSQHAPSVSRYKLEGEFARGGMGAIWKVWDEDLRRHLAMKVVLGRGEPGSTGATPSVDSKQLARFLEEAQVTGQLDHPGIVPVHELGLDSEGRVYFTMKLVKGRDLKTIFDLVFEEQEGWNETRALGVILRICEAMAYAHAKGVIHRDLKPANVMVGNFGEVYVMDWGLSRVLGRKDGHDIRIAPEFSTLMASVKTERRDAREALSDSPIVTMDGDVIGTPAYMSPEQARGEVEKLSPRSDVYALGAMLYHLLARQMPFVPKGARMSAHTVLLRVLEGAPKDLITLAPSAPEELVAIVDKAMARDASQRYADTLALADDLRAFLEHRVVGAYETGAWAETKKWVQRNKPLAASLGGAVVLLVAGLTASLVFKARADERAADLLTASTIIRSKNTELEAATKAAQASEQSAKEHETLAKIEEARARAERANVLKLSAFQTLDDLTKEAEALWPADPQLIPAYRSWMKRADDLVAKLPDFRASLAELELRAVPQSEEERAQERASHPRARELEVQAGRLEWMKRMLGEEAWPSETDVAVSLSKEMLPTDADDLNDLAWPLVDPEKPVFGSEVRGYLLARRAVEASAEHQRYACRDTLAWALFRLGRFDEALAQEEQALAEAEDGMKSRYASFVAKLERAVNGWRDSEGKARESRAKEREELAQTVAALETEVSKRRHWQFAEDASSEESGDRWWQAQLVKLIAALESFEDLQTGLMRGVSGVHGWGVARRLDFAASIEERTLSGAEAKRLWSEASAAIASSSKYGGLKQTPQLGLLPIGADPESGLWEFWHVQSGEEPERGGDGKLILTERMGIVLVLIPGGTFTLGAQKSDKTRPNYDELAEPDEAHYEVQLDAYFLSKYEMTQGQWEMFTGTNPSTYQERNYRTNWNRKGKGWSALHPVERVSWTQSRATLERLGLVLPTEAQWERGCRGSTSTVYSSGDDSATLAAVGNVADLYAKTHGGSGWSVLCEAWDDGNLVHAEVGSYRPNDLGLHDMHGNVWEWCERWPRTAVNSYPGDGEREIVNASIFAYRGGSFRNAASQARSATRNFYLPESRKDVVGLRPARASQLPAPRPHAAVK